MQRWPQKLPAAFALIFRIFQFLLPLAQLYPAREGAALNRAAQIYGGQELCFCRCNHNLAFWTVMGFRLISIRFERFELIQERDSLFCNRKRKYGRPLAIWNPLNRLPPIWDVPRLHFCLTIWTFHD